MLESTWSIRILTERGSASVRCRPGGMRAKDAPKRRQAPFGTSMWPLGARHPCLATLLHAFPRGCPKFWAWL